jgi:hypothetical protein
MIAHMTLLSPKMTDVENRYSIFKMEICRVDSQRIIGNQYISRSYPCPYYQRFLKGRILLSSEALEGRTSSRSDGRRFGYLLSGQAVLLENSKHFPI